MCEDAPCCGCCPVEQFSSFGRDEEIEEILDRHDNEDDLADFNANEANDYLNE